MASAHVFLDAFLAPLLEPLARPDVTDLYINAPGEIWLETRTGIERHDAPALNDAALWRLARQVAAASDQGISREHPLLAAALQDGSRIQVCAPPRDARPYCGGDPQAHRARSYARRL